jgi:hypothetical protein
LRFGAKSHVRPRRSPAQAEHFAQHWKPRGFHGGQTGIAKNSFVGKHAAMMVAYLPANKSKPRRVAA